MEINAKLNMKFYIVAVLLLGLVIFGWYGVWFLNANTILMEDDTVMTPDTKLAITVIFSAIILTWTLSLLTVFSLAIKGRAFTMDESGIHDTATGLLFLSLILIVPVRNIPYKAIKKVEKENGGIVIHIDKSKIDVNPMVRLFVRRQYSFFAGFTRVKTDEIEAILDRFVE